MKRLALLMTAAALALPAAVASADPDVRVQVRGEARLEPGRGDVVVLKRDRYERFDRSRWGGREYRGRWNSLGFYNSQTDAQALHLDGRRYGKLRIEATRGAPVIERMVIDFGNGRTQVVDLNMRLTPGVGEVIDLDGVRDRRIARIMVYSAPRTRGTFQVFGS